MFSARFIHKSCYVQAMCVFHMTFCFHIHSRHSILHRRYTISQRTLDTYEIVEGYDGHVYCCRIIEGCPRHCLLTLFNYYGNGYICLITSGTPIQWGVYKSFRSSPNIMQSSLAGAYPHPTSNTN